MFETSLNSRTVTLKLKRRDVVDLMMACTTFMQMDLPSEKWLELHEKLRTMVDDFDRKVMSNDGN